MTSRLKRKLDYAGIDPSSSRVNESFCLIGTPLPPLEKSKDANEFVPVWKQDVRDEQGRRRLHGAFTGGFSAGYFNTVGSKEGWTPATFKSSRGSRANNKNARPEDFMDEEDLEEMRASQTMVDTTEEMDLTGGTMRSGPEGSAEDSMANTLALALLPSTKDSAGASLLRKMGWKAGQGVGPRMTYAQLQKVQGIKSEPTEDEEAQKHLYARKDTPLIVFRPKENTFGVGYVHGAGLNVQGYNDTSEGASSRAPNISAGFGLGAVNDADDDDLDVYDNGLSRGVDRHAFEDEGPREKVTLGAGSRGGKDDFSRSQRHDRSAGLRQLPNDVFNDGRPVLAGFQRSSEPLVEDTWFKLPDVPKGWTPDPHRVWATAATEADRAQISTRQQAGHKNQRWTESGKTVAEERGEKLGEAALPQQTSRSVFDYLAHQDRERLHAMAAKAKETREVKPDQKQTVDDRPVKDESDRPQAPLAPVTISIPNLDPRIAKSALHGFQPFAASDPAKQARYTAYLQSQAHPDPSSLDHANPPPLKAGQSVELYNKELEDYARAAMIFKPISGAMANRFTSAAIVDKGPNVVEGLRQPLQFALSGVEDSGSTSAAGDGAVQKQEVEETPKENAARLGMFGPLTHEVKPWGPARLLCKRFGIKPPQLEGSAEGAQGTAGGALASDRPGNDLDAADADFKDAYQLPGSTPVVAANGTGAVAGSDTISSANRSGPRDISNIGLGEDDTQGAETLTYQRPDMDIFKAIFASDEEDSSDEEQEEVKPPSVINAPTPAPPSSGAKDKANENVDLNTFKPRFVPQSERKRDSQAVLGASTGERSSKKAKRSKADSSLLSFGMDQDGDDTLVLVPSKSSKEKKKKRKEHQAASEKAEGNSVESRKKSRTENDDDEWVEKTPPRTQAIIPDQNLLAAAVPDAQSFAREPHGDGGGLRGSRPKASDYL